MMTGLDKRKQAWRKGFHAETLAAWILRLKGYRILARRYKTPRGEIDLIAKRGTTLIFVEVKARSAHRPEQTFVETRQMQRIAAAADIYLQQGILFNPRHVRFDVMYFVKNRLPCHLKDIWRPS